MYVGVCLSVQEDKKISHVMREAGGAVADGERHKDTTKKVRVTRVTKCTYVLKGNTHTLTDTVHFVMQVPTHKPYSSNSYNWLEKRNTPTQRHSLNTHTNAELLKTFFLMLENKQNKKQQI